MQANQKVDEDIKNEMQNFANRLKAEKTKLEKELGAEHHAAINKLNKKKKELTEEEEDAEHEYNIFMQDKDKLLKLLECGSTKNVLNALRQQALQPENKITRRNYRVGQPKDFIDTVPTERYHN